MPGGGGDMNDDRLPVVGERNAGDNAGRKRSYVTVSILCIVNLLNYMDRFTIAGVLPDVQKFYNISDSYGGLLQTSFVCSYMIFAPIFGYLGDRYSRKTILAGGVFFWSLTALAGSFIPADHFWLFLVCRGLVGIGEASYSTIAPTIIADLFTSSQRSKMLAAFYFAIPVGSGAGYIVGANVAKALNSWEWSLRVTPFFGVVCVVFIIGLMVEPPRGDCEGGDHLKATGWGEDLKDLAKNRSFIWSTLGFTCVAFVAGALAWWGPTFLDKAAKLQGYPSDLAQISLIFGVITVIAGITGVSLGAFLSGRLRQRYQRTDPLICGFALLFSVPLFFFGSIVAKTSIPYAYVLIFFAEVFLSMTWAIVADILLYVVIPTRRSTAEAVQILISHAFGDAGSPYLVGIISERLQESSLWASAPSIERVFTSLQYALFTTCFMDVLGALAFIVTSWYIVNDKLNADRLTKGVDDVELKTMLSKGDPIRSKRDSKQRVQSKAIRTYASEFKNGASNNHHHIQDGIIQTKVTNGIPKNAL